MPGGKKANLQCAKNFSSRGGAPQQAGQADLDAIGNEPVNSGTNVTLDDKVSPAYIHTELSYTPESPNKLVGDLNNLSLEVLLGSNLVLEDPPNNNNKDPIDAWNPSSLAEPNDDKALALHLFDAKEPEDDEGKHSEPMNQEPIPWDKAEAMANNLNAIIQSSFHGHGKTRVSSLSHVVLSWLQSMAGTLNLIVAMDMTLMNVSLMVAVVFGQGEWAVQQVCKWIREYQKQGKLPTNVYRTWNESVMEDEDLLATIQDWLRDKGKYVWAANIIDFFGTAAAEQYAQLIDWVLSLSMAQQWMHWMGYSWSKEHCSQFADGHKQEDVRNYQVNVYIPKWIKLEQQMQSWDEKGNEIPPKLNKGECPVVVWFHNESTFYAHDWQLL